MRGRQVCWSNDKLRALAKKFVPASDEVWRLHNHKALDCLFFQGFCEAGHYGGRERPTTTRQGIYCCSPSGKFLASVNTTDPKRMTSMLREALAAWSKMPKAERYLDYDPATRAAEIERASNRYPADGLALRVYSRDMPRPGSKQPKDWRTTAWNVDSLWYRADEARDMLPASLKVGAEHGWPAPLVQRFVQNSLLDNVRGQTNRYEDSHVQVAEMTTVVAGRKGKQVTLVMRGRSRATSTGTWPATGLFSDLTDPGRNARGVQTSIYGEAVYDTNTKRFVQFELACRGTRWGQTTYNFRQGDLDASPIGFVLRLDPEDPGARVAPAHMHRYGW